MFRYLQAAFFVRPMVPLLGGVPINVLACILFGILGVVQPGFWLLGAGLISGGVLMLASSPRFRKLVDAKALQASDWQAEAMEKTLVSQLPLAARQRLDKLDATCDRVVTAYKRTDGVGQEFVIESSAEALKKLRWLYLKLLVAETALNAASVEARPEAIQREIDQMQREIQTAGNSLSPSLRDSRLATLDILNKRLSNSQKRKQSLAEIEGDLSRIEAQIDLALDDATLKGQPTAISGNIDLASQLLDSGIFGDSERMVIDLDRRLDQQTGSDQKSIAASPPPLPMKEAE